MKNLTTSDRRLLRWMLTQCEENHHTLKNMSGDAGVIEANQASVADAKILVGKLIKAEKKS